MKKILIATHGYLADGFKSSISLLTGGEDAIETICAYVDESDYTERIQAFVDSIGQMTTASSLPTSTAEAYARRWHSSLPATPTYSIFPVATWGSSSRCFSPRDA